MERILESPFESDRPIAHLRLDSVDKKLSSMEPTRLQPPVMGGTKGRAIQQAKEMETLVAERAKRSGDEPPPYDFYELIGKGAYGRVFKGYVWPMYEPAEANSIIARAGSRVDWSPSRSLTSTKSTMRK